MKNQKKLPTVEELQKELEIIVNSKTLNKITYLPRTADFKNAVKTYKSMVKKAKGNVNYTYIANTIEKKILRNKPDWGNLRVLNIN